MTNPHYRDDDYNYGDFDDYGWPGERESYRERAFREMISVLENNFPDLGKLNVLEIATMNGQFTGKLVEVFKHVTTIDPELDMKEDYDNLTKEKERFDCDRDCSNYDLLVSNSACTADESMVCASQKYNVPFFAILCSCAHGFKSKHARYEALKSKSPNATLYKDTNAIWYLTSLNTGHKKD
ncbi:MAG: hypothetical protein FWC79_00425 [Oscillospiraceae bacterium]|nr:hypothetical protein [Oscillospiraceae bacterium]